jgi:hypothetical protein
VAVKVRLSAGMVEESTSNGGRGILGVANGCGWRWGENSEPSQWEGARMVVGDGRSSRLATTVDFDNCKKSR